MGLLKTSAAANLAAVVSGANRWLVSAGGLPRRGGNRLGDARAVLIC
jgi:hypothetical protein